MPNPKVAEPATIYQGKSRGRARDSTRPTRSSDDPVSVRAAVLLALGSGPRYGLELIERIKHATNGRVKLSQGRTYPLLHELEGEGLLVSFEAPAAAAAGKGGRPRRYFQLLDAGHKEARELRRDLEGLIRPT